MDGERRRWLVRVWAALGSLVGLQGGWVAAEFLRPRSRPDVPDRLFTAGPVDRFAPNTVTAFPDGRFYLVRLEDGGFLALYRECTHLGCTVPWDEARGRFACPCHSSVYDIRGTVLNPPAPRPLDWLSVRVENGIVKVDVSQRHQRDAFDRSQVAL
jgi:cytochrome b6-f complex iron-sulfur subunit